MRAEDRRTISWLGLAVALPHSAISPSVRPQPVQTLELVSSSQICLHGDGGRGVIASKDARTQADHNRNYANERPDPMFFHKLDCGSWVETMLILPRRVRLERAV
jgi:hypothetical protein